ncbi:MAG: hypothetical protein NC311_19090 [Muribaculaceae bacterium]|nr:hypothetical protein [Muribaculaceae bacterium]
MMDLNPYGYDTLEAHEFDRNMAKRNLEMIAEATAKRVVEAVNRDVPPEELHKTVIEASEAVCAASIKLRYEENALKRKKEAEGE